jgi:hypothetical protein
MERTDNFIIESNKPTVEEVVPEAVAEEITNEAPIEELSAEENEAPKAQSKSRAQKRIESLIQEKHELARKVQELETKKESKTNIEADDFEDYDDYLEAVKKSKKTEAPSSINLVIEQIQEKFQDAMEKYPDFDTKTQDKNLALTNELLEVLNESEDAGEVAYYLANNPKETERIASLSQRKMAIEIGKIELKLTLPKETPKVIPKKITQANEPITPIGGGNGLVKTIYTADTQSEFEAMRRNSSKANNGFV